MRARYGAEASQDFTPYENFQGKARSVLLLCNWLFLLYLLKIRKDLVKGVLALKSRFQILSWFCLFFACFF
ncbi:hypothetical protein AA18_05080 [Salmonella enterica]|nr:hypothetical protein [Salmonella enterica]EBH8586959.1 hypothetical protein [Salmonella enterica subsp. enterica serovar Pomona]